jgi:hypothetical protein
VVEKYYGKNFYREKYLTKLFSHDHYTMADDSSCSAVSDAVSDRIEYLTSKINDTTKSLGLMNDEVQELLMVQQRYNKRKLHQSDQDDSKSSDDVHHKKQTIDSLNQTEASKATHSTGYTTTASATETDITKVVGFSEEECTEAGDKFTGTTEEICTVKGDYSIDDLLKILVTTENTDGVVNYIRNKWPKSYHTYISTLKKKWLDLNIQCDEFDLSYDHMVNKIHVIMQGSSTDKQSELTEVLHRVSLFHDMSVKDRNSLQKAMNQQQFSGNENVDNEIKQMVIFPEYIQSLRATQREKEMKKQHSSSQLQKKCQSTWMLNVAHVIEQARASLISDTSNAYDLAVALALVTGRRMVEIFKEGVFIQSDRDDRVKFSGQVKAPLRVESLVGSDEGVKSSYEIPLLTSAVLVLKGLDRLRRVKNCELLSKREVNAKYANGCNAGARRLLGEGRKFHDLRSAYAVTTFHCAQPHIWSQNLWVCRVLGHYDLKNSITYSAVRVQDLQQEHKFVWPEAM